MILLFQLMDSSGVLPIHIPPKDYRIDKGDMLKVSVFSRKVKVWDYVEYVDGRGYFPVKVSPYSSVGKVKISGLSLDSASRIIYIGIKKFIPKIDIINLDLVKPAEFYVYIYGNVQESGPVRVSSLTRLSDVVVKENTLPFSSLNRIYLNGETFSIWKGLRGDIKNNPLLRSGDSIFIPKTDSVVFVVGFFTKGYRRPVEYNQGDDIISILWKAGYGISIDKIAFVKKNGKIIGFYDKVSVGDTIEFVKYPNYVLVSGEVKNPTSVEYSPGLTIIDYINLAGGFTDKASSGGIYIKKFGHSKFFKVSPDYIPEPGDIIYVPRTFLTYGEILTTMSFIISTTSLVITLLKR